MARQNFFSAVEMASMTERMFRSKSCLLKNASNQEIALKGNYILKKVRVDQEYEKTKVLRKDRAQLIEYCRDLKNELDFCKAKV